jgi:hypothetical protein
MSPPTITPRSNANNREGARAPLPTRAELDAAARQVVKRGEWNKADLTIIDIGGGPMVVKDFAGKNWWTRLLGRLQIAREQRAYRCLGEMPGIPALIGRIDAYAIAIQKIEGRQLGFIPEITRDGAARLGQLRRLIDGMHAAGLVHWDLRARENVLVTGEGQLFVIDFASALWLRPGGLAHRFLFRWLTWVDESAYLKWKGILQAGPYSEEEEAFLRRCEFWRAFWIFNRKKRAARENDDER